MASLAAVLACATACVSNPKAGSVDNSSAGTTDAPPTTAAIQNRTSSTTPGDAQVAPALPESAQGLTVPAAESFVKFYFSALSYAQLTGDASTVRAFSDVGCRHCAAFAKDSEARNRGNGRLGGDLGWKDVTVTSVVLTDPRTGDVKATARTGRVTYRTGNGTTPLVDGPHDFDIHITLAARGSQWVMFDLDGSPA